MSSPTPRLALLLSILTGLLAVGCGTHPVDPVVQAPLRSSPTPTRGGGGGGGGGGVPAPTPPPTTNPLVISTTLLADGNIGSRYSDFITTTGGGGTSPIRFRLVAGRLPSGLSMLSSFGVQSTLISGTPTTAGTSTFTVQAQDGAGHTASKVLSIVVHGAAPLVINSPSPTLAPGTVGAAYAIAVFSIGGTQPYTWSIVSGLLPPGLHLSGNVISGTPTTAGTFSFTARVADSGGQSASEVFSITVAP
jgi:hypothetical protein